MSFAKFLRTPFLTEHLWWLLLFLLLLLQHTVSQHLALQHSIEFPQTSKMKRFTAIISRF